MVMVMMTINFVLWLTDGRAIVLFPAGTVAGCRKYVCVQKKEKVDFMTWF